LLLRQLGILGRDKIEITIRATKAERGLNLQFRHLRANPKHLNCTQRRKMESGSA
jgi:hypothetical protein